MNPPIDISEAAGLRYLHFGSEWVQGAMRIRRPYALELAYTREMMAGLVLRDAGHWPRNALLIGLGAASLTRFIHHHCPDTRIEVVEIEPRVVAAAQQFFKLPEDSPRMHVHVGDGAEFILSTPRRYDYILVDGYDRNARAGALDTLPFYQAVRARLSERGVMSVNLFGRSRGFKASVERIIQACLALHQPGQRLDQCRQRGRCAPLGGGGHFPWLCGADERDRTRTAGTDLASVASFRTPLHCPLGKYARDADHLPWP